MHEMALTTRMLELIEAQALQSGFRRVARVILEIGRLSGVEPEAIRFAFDVVTRDSVAEGAELVIEATPGRARCPACGAEAAVQACYDPCAACGGFPQEILAGRDLRLLALDVD